MDTFTRQCLELDLKHLTNKQILYLHNLKNIAQRKIIKDYIKQIETNQ